MKKIFAAMALLWLVSFPARAAIVTREVPYTDGGVHLQGYLAYDDGLASRAPGVVIVHEWWGHNDYARKRAEQLAALGYIAFAADMYGKGILATTPDEAKALSAPFYADRHLMRSRALAALEVLKAQPGVDPSSLAVMGYCFGGSVALELARSGADIKGAVSFHGGLATDLPAKKDEVRAQILVLNGAADTFVPEAEKKAFADEMTAAGVSFKAIDYPGATHAFTNPAADDLAKKFALPIAYNQKADVDSWDEMAHFFRQIFALSHP